MEDRFKLIFIKLQEALDEDPNAAKPAPEHLSADELDDLDEVRRAVVEVTDPEPQSYTTT